MKKYVTLSYDDGAKFDRPFVEMLNAYGIKCTFNLISSSMPPSDREAWYVSREEARELYRGHEIATHSLTHPHLEQLSKEDIEHEIREDIKNLTEIAGYPVLGHAYPYGTYNELVVDTLREIGIRYARTVKATSAFDPPEDPLLFHPTTHHRNPEVFRLIDEFLAAEPKDHDLVFYLWGHSFELDRGEEFNSWAHMERVLKALSGKPDVNYVTNMEFIERR